MSSQIKCGLISRVFLKFRCFIEWLFADAVRPTEITNAVTLMAFSAIFMVGRTDIVLEYPYRGFAFAGCIWIWIAMFALGGCQWVAATRKSIRSDRRSAIILVISSIVYLVMVGVFSSDYPPLSTAVPVYFILGTFCLFGSVRRITHVREITDAIKP